MAVGRLLPEATAGVLLAPIRNLDRRLAPFGRKPAYDCRRPLAGTGDIIESRTVSRSVNPARPARQRMLRTERVVETTVPG